MRIFKQNSIQRDRDGFVLPVRKVRNNFAVLLFIFFAFLLVAGIAVFLNARESRAAVGINRQINFQGKLTNPDGTNVSNGSYSIRFTLYDASSAGTNLWQDTYNLTVTNGVFRVALGSGSVALPTNFDFNSDNLYLGIKVGTDAEMTPRIRFTAVPYAFNAEKVAGLTVTSTTGTLTIPNSKTISFADAFTTAGAFSMTLTATGATNVTLPTSGTLATLTNTETFTNKTLASAILRTTAQSGTGTITTSGAMVSGLSTSFTTQLAVGDVIKVGGQKRFVVSISSDTGLVTKVQGDNFVDVGTPASFTYEKPIARLQDGSATTKGAIGAFGNYIYGTPGSNTYYPVSIVSSSDNIGLYSDVSGNSSSTGVYAKGSNRGLEAYSNSLTTNYAVYAQSNGLGSYDFYGANSSGYGYFAGNLGIGDDTPTSRISLAAATDAAGGIDFGGDTNLYRSSANKLQTDDEFFINGNNFGLVSSANGNAFTLINTALGAFNETILSINPYTASGTNSSIVQYFRSINTTGSVGIELFRGNNTSNINTFLSANGNSYLNALTGNVGIGLSSPTARLSVTGSVAVTGTGTISSSGTTVTGASTTFNSQLHVGDTITASGQTKIITAITNDISLTTDTAFNPVISAGTSFTYTQPVTRLATNAGTQAFVVTGSGSVGFGTASPTDMLHVHGSTNDTILKITNTSTGTGSSADGVAFGVANSNQFYFMNYETGGIIFGNGGNERARIDNTGLGIGTTSPNSRLDLGQLGANATSTATQSSSGAISLTGSFWNGSAQGKNRFTIQNVASTTSNNAGSLDFGWNSTKLLSLESGGALRGSTSLSSLVFDRTSFTLEFNTNSTIRAGGMLNLHNYGNTTATSTSSVVFSSIFSNVHATGTVNPLQASHSFAPASGSAVFNTFTLNPTINQTGGANGITRGILIDPTLTSATDFRALETVRGNVVFGSTSGNVGIGTSDPLARLSANSSPTSTASTNNNVILTNMYPTPASTSATVFSSIYGMNQVPALAASINLSNHVDALRGYVSTSSQGTSTSMTGVRTDAINQGSGTVNNLAAGRFTVSNTGSGTTSIATGVAIETPNFSTGTVSTAFGVSIRNMGAATVGTAYGLYLYNQTGATTNYSIYSAGGQSYHAGNFGIGDTSPASALTVGSGDLFQVDSNGDPVRIKNVTYSWPTGQGGANQVLMNDGNGTLSWGTTAGSGTVMGSGTASQVAFWSNATTVTSSSNLFWNNTNARLGIGTSSPDNKLTISGTAADINNGPHIKHITSSDVYPVFHQLNWNHDNIAMSFDAYYDNAWRSSALGSNFQIYKYSNALNFNYANNVAAGSVATFSTGITLSSTGNVGIGGASSSKLGIANNVSTGNIDAFSKYQLTLYEAATAADSYGLGVEGSHMWFNSGANYKWYSTGSTALMGLTSSGLGIGIAAPSAKLHVAPNGAGGILIGGNSAGLSNGNTTLSVGVSAVSNGYSYLQSVTTHNSTYGDIVLNQSGGNVAIGTSTPSAKLDVTGGYLRARQSSPDSNVAPTSGRGLEFVGTGGIGYVQSYNRDGAAFQPLHLQGSYIFANNNIGIGTTSTVGSGLTLNSNSQTSLGYKYGDVQRNSIYYNHEGTLGTLNIARYNSGGSWVGVMLQMNNNTGNVSVGSTLQLSGSNFAARGQYQSIYAYNGWIQFLDSAGNHAAYLGGSGRLRTKEYIFPGRADIAGGSDQNSWYLGSHGSYGLYTNTGLYLEGGITTVGTVSSAGMTATGNISTTGATMISAGWDLVAGRNISAGSQITAGNYISSTTYMYAQQSFRTVGKTTFGAGWGAGLEIDFDGSRGEIISINRNDHSRLGLRLYASDIQIAWTAQRGERLCHSGGNTANTVDVFIGDCTTVGTDFAEMYHTLDTSIEAADIVTQDTTQPVVEDIFPDGVGYASKVAVKKATQSDTAALMGIVSTNPFNEVLGKDMYKPEENPLPVALNGRVPVKVNTSNGDIQAGDLITVSSTPGVGMKATKASFIVGKALESYTNPDPTKVGKIVVFVTNFYYNPVTAESEIWALSEGVATTSYPLTIKGNLTAEKGTFTSIYTTLLSVGGDALTIDANGKLITKNDIEAKGIVAATFKSAEAMIDTLKVNKLLVNRAPVDKDNNALDPVIAKVVLKSGDQQMIVTNKNVTTGASIFITTLTKGAPNLSVTEKTDGVGFVVETEQAVTKDIEFEYWIVGE